LEPHFPELHIDPYNHTFEEVKPKFIHLEDDLYYQFIPLLENHIAYFGKMNKKYYPTYTSTNISEDREADIAIAHSKWAAKRDTHDTMNATSYSSNWHKHIDALILQQIMRYYD
jgi:hypothetical protein